jgi:hypothetical protein
VENAAVKNACLGSSAIRREIEKRPGLIPIDLDTGADRITWADLGQYHCYHGFFGDSLLFWRSLDKSGGTCFVTPFKEIVDSVGIPENSFLPTAFIFHAGRCRSTVLAQAVARCRGNLVFSEAAPHNQIWNAARADFRDFRSLVLIMGRRRLPGYRCHIIKFTSFNILRFRQIRAAFPGVPALFLYRDPRAIVESLLRQKPPWLGRQSQWCDALSSAETAVEAFFRAALSVEDPEFRCLNSEFLRPDTLRQILGLLNADADPKDLRTMRDAFLWDSKTGLQPRRYVPTPDEEARRSACPALPEKLLDLYSQLLAKDSLKAG